MSLICIDLTSYRPKHCTMVYVRAAINIQGRGATFVFDGTMKKKLLIRILDSTLLPSIQISTPEHYHHMMDIHSKHTS